MPGLQLDRLETQQHDFKAGVSLNPASSHRLDSVRSILPLMLILSRTGFGWAKPVQYDPFNLKNPRKDGALISLAGPGIEFITGGNTIYSTQIVHLFNLSNFLL